MNNIDISTRDEGSNYLYIILNDHEDIFQMWVHATLLYSNLGMLLSLILSAITSIDVSLVIIRYHGLNKKWHI